MDYNKEEADRARDAAMEKFLAKDYAGAKKFALKAQSMNPEIAGIKEMVATFVMHLAAQHTINGVIDYYGVLGVKPEADDETVKKRYIKLNEMFNPDTKKLIGGEEAFMFVSQAWDALSDKEKRADYDKKRKNEASPTEQANNGVQKSAKRKTAKRVRDASASSSAAATINGTFWTVCSTCKTQFEYSRVYLNKNLMCCHCRKPFIAMETDPPHSSSTRETFVDHKVDYIRHLTDGRKKERDNNDVDSTECGAVYTGTINAAPSANSPKIRKVMENAVAGSSSSPNSSSVREFSEVELKNVLMKKSKPTIVTKLEDLMTEDVNMVSAGSSQNKSSIESSCCVDSVEDAASGTDKDLTVTVPDSDFCDFHKNRTEKSFSDNQIWASYDLLEGMPRVYFMIDKVLCVDPFKMRITQLDAPLNRLGLGLGGFIAGESQICHSFNLFSHKVEVMMGNNQGEFLIYPRTGDVWALYKNWNYLAEGKEVEYDVVEVVEGYTEEFGVVTVVPLTKVAGFKSVFRSYLGSKEVRSISKDELSRFSHQIPSYLLTGKEGVDELRGCRQLDTAAIPSQLLQIIDG